MKQPIILQRLEGALIFLGATYVYYLRGGDWLLFILVFFAIDVSMSGYLINKKIGALVYNIGHTLIVPILIYLAARITDSGELTMLSLVWFAHIGLDRALGYGFKLPAGFKHTHLGTIGVKN
jgi:hypothetical protein